MTDLGLETALRYTTYLGVETALRHGNYPCLSFGKGLQGGEIYRYLYITIRRRVACSYRHLKIRN